MTTSEATAGLNHSALRRLVDEANTLPLSDRITLLKGLIPGLIPELAPREFGRLIAELELKGGRMYEALDHPGLGREARRIPGEREIEGR